MTSAESQRTRLSPDGRVPEIGRVVVSTVFENEALDDDIPQAAHVRGKDPSPRREFDRLFRRCPIAEVDGDSARFRVEGPCVRLLLDFFQERHLGKDLTANKHLAAVVDQIRVAIAKPVPLRLAVPPVWRRGHLDSEGVRTVDVDVVDEHCFVDRTEVDRIVVLCPLGSPDVGTLDNYAAEFFATVRDRLARFASARWSHPLAIDPGSHQDRIARFGALCRSPDRSERCRRVTYGTVVPRRRNHKDGGARFVCRQNERKRQNYSTYCESHGRSASPSQRISDRRANRLYSARSGIAVFPWGRFVTSLGLR